MKLFLDTSDVEIVKRWLDTGAVAGVTTNPAIMLKNHNWHCCGKLVELCKPLPVSLEVLSETPSEMIAEAIKLRQLGDNVVVKVPVHGRNGESYLGIVRALVSEGVKVNVTAMMNAQQCLLAALAGARYASIFAGRIADMGYNACEEILRAHALLGSADLKCEIIAASVRESRNVVDWLLAGADVVTVTPETFDKLLVHPYTKETVDMFMKAAEKMQ